MVLQGIIRAVCAIIDAFHFSVESQQPPAVHSTGGNSLQAAVDDQGQEEAAGGDSDAEATADAVAAHADIQAALTRRVLPTLRGQLVKDGEVGHHSSFIICC